MDQTITEQSKLDIFVSEYRKQLEKSLFINPHLYAWQIDQIDIVMGRMIQAIANGSFNKDSPAFRNTCKALKIPYTYKAISDFING